VDWWVTDVREKMVQDLLKSDTLIGLDKTTTIQLLGQPERIESHTFDYLVREKYGMNIDPIYIKYLSIEFNQSGNAFRARMYQIN